MTRETKAGIVVSCSFVCLVTVVLFAKLRERDRVPAKNDQPDLALVPGDPTPLEKKSAPEPGEITKTATGSRGVEPVRFTSDEDGGSLTPPGSPRPAKPVARENGKTEPATVRSTAVPEFPFPIVTSPLAQAVPDGTKSSAPLAAKSSSSGTVATLPRAGTDSPVKIDSSSTSGPTLNGSWPTAMTPGSKSPGGLTTATNPYSLGGTAPKQAGDSALATRPAEQQGQRLADNAPPLLSPRTDMIKSGGPGDLILPGRDQPGSGRANTTSPKQEAAQSPWQLPDQYGLPPSPRGTASAGAVKSDNIPGLMPGGSPAARSGTSTPLPNAGAFPLPTTASQPSTASSTTAGPIRDSGSATGPASSQQRLTNPDGTMVLPPLGALNLSPNTDDSRAKDIRLGTPSATSPAARQLAQGPSNTLPFSKQPDPSAGRLEQPANSPARFVPIPVIVPAVAPSSNQPGAIAQVESYNEQTYVCRPNDTFRAISQAYFGTPKYERALMLLNRNHPLATEALRQNPPVLREGEKIYIPEARILDKNYSAVIEDGSQAGPATAGPEHDTSADAKSYRVRPNGEMFYEIARRTLGNGERWQEIYRLNPRFDPKDPVPAGSEIRLPWDARIEPADAPQQ
jgi:hypothetical protein